MLANSDLLQAEKLDRAWTNKFIKWYMDTEDEQGLGDQIDDLNIFLNTSILVVKLYSMLVVAGADIYTVF